MDLKKQYIIAHRGASALVDFENTLEAFEKAIEIGTPVMEFDVRRTKDLVLVSFHDDNIDGEKISDLTYCKLNELTEKKGFKVPTLEQILQISKGRIILDIELKEAGYEHEIVELVTKYLDYNQFIIKSFIEEAIYRVKSIDIHIKTGLLLGVDRPKYGIFTRISEFFPLYRILRSKADFVAPYHKLILSKRLQYLKFPVLVWTVNDERLMERLLKKGVNGIITDRPDKGLKVFNQLKLEAQV